MEREELVRRAQRVMAAWNDHDPLRLAVFYAPDSTTRDCGQPMQHGREGVVRRAQHYFRASVDLDLRLRSVQVDGRTTFSRWLLRGTHTGTLHGIAPTGRRVEIEGLSVHEWTDSGYVQSETIYWDQAQLLRSIGGLGGPPETEPLVSARVPAVARWERSRP